MSFNSVEYDEEDFDAAFFEYARRALEMAGISTDENLKREKPIRHSLLHAVGEQSAHYLAARDAVPKSSADWEVAAFVGIATRAAMWDLQWGSIRNFAQFDYLYRRILGELSRPYLPMVFAAAAWAPMLKGDFAFQLLGTMPDRQWDALYQ